MSIVTVSRELGSDGDIIARGVAERLGYRYVDQEALAAESRKYVGDEVSPSTPELAERPPSFWSRLIEERRRYSTVLKCVIYEIAEKDAAVIVGRGAEVLLGGLKHVLKVKVVAPKETRMERLRALQDLRGAGAPTGEELRERLKQSDREKAGYVRYLFSVDWMNPHLYDVVLSTGNIHVPTAVEFLSKLATSPEFQPCSASLSRLDDLAVGSRVEAVLLNRSGVWIHALQVRCEQGAVTVSGEVLTEEDRDSADKAIREIAGVPRFSNELRIQPPPLAGI